jgi:DMSO/TMAO reductase YedYZ molybdopterin-dependent catalytic subunit
MQFFRRPSGPSDRLPPGQHLVTNFPVLHYGGVPRADLSTWTFRIWGLVEEEITWTYEELTALPTTRIVRDIHCVTTWSKLDTEWEGVAVPELMRHVRLKPEARFVLVHAEQGFTTNLALEDFVRAPFANEVVRGTDFVRDDNLFAWRYAGAELTPEHGWPLRLVVPHLYFWKSAKWVRGLEFMAKEKLGFWETHGYHPRGDPWTEERFG